MNDLRFAPGHLNGSSRRVLSVSQPRARLEGVVVDAIDGLKKKHAKDLKRAEEVIEEYGLTIEATRLRDRLEQAALSDLDQLLLSTPGVIETLFLEAIKSELEEAERERASGASSGKPPGKPKRPPRKRPPKGSGPGPAPSRGGAPAASKAPAAKKVTAARKVTAAKKVPAAKKAPSGGGTP